MEVQADISSIFKQTHSRINYRKARHDTKSYLRSTISATTYIHLSFLLFQAMQWFCISIWNMLCTCQILYMQIYQRRIPSISHFSNCANTHNGSFVDRNVSIPALKLYHGAKVAKSSLFAITNVMNIFFAFSLFGQHNVQ